MVIVYSPRCLTYEAAGHPENPRRVQRMVERLEPHGYTWLEPAPCPNKDLLRVHAPGLLEAVREGKYFDVDTPFFPEIDALARLSAGGAILAAEQALGGQRAFSLMRPPGHHAESARCMGFCYYNNVAVASARLLASGQARRIAILDIDCHHGNGTEEIFRRDPRVLYVSLHQAPCYPGTGLVSNHNSLNFPLPPGTDDTHFLEVLEQALAAVAEFKPSVIAVSAGFDSYKDDPITHMGLEVEAFSTAGEWLHEFRVPVFAALEGGYADDVGLCVEAFVTRWEHGSAIPLRG